MSEVKTTSLEAFAKQLRAWRAVMGWTQVETGDKLGYSASLISGIETSDKNPTYDFALACDKTFKTPGFRENPDGTFEPGTFMTLQELVAREAYPAFFAPVVAFEQDAVRIHGWELGSIPGLLQTEDYARAHIRAGRPQDSEEDIGRLVDGRIQRQTILVKEHPPMTWYVIDEGVLRHLTGGPAIMGAQLDALIAAAASTGIVIQVLPFDARENAGADGAIAIYEFTRSPAVCYTECYAGGRIVEVPAEVAELMTVMSLLRASALPPHESLDLVRQIRSEIDAKERTTLA